MESTIIKLKESNANCVDIRDAIDTASTISYLFSSFEFGPDPDIKWILVLMSIVLNENEINLQNRCLRYLGSVF